MPEREYNTEWNTQEIASALQALLPANTIQVESSLGDYFTNQIKVPIPDSDEFVCCHGFTTTGPLSKEGNGTIEAVELHDSECDGSGGMQSTNPKTRQVFRTIQDYLEMEKKYHVVPTSDGHF